MRASALFWRSRAAGAHEGGHFCADDREIFGFRVFFEPIHVFFGDRHIGIDGLDRAFREAGVAVDAGVGVDQEAVGGFVKGLDRADGGAIGVLTFDARRGDNIGHDKSSEFRVSGSKFRWLNCVKPTKVWSLKRKSQIKTVISCG